MDKNYDTMLIDDERLRRWYFIDGVLSCDELPDVKFECSSSKEALEILVKEGYLLDDGTLFLGED